MHTHLQVSLPAVPGSVREARDTIGDVAAKAGAPQRVIDDARLCVSEAVANVVRHAYGLGEGDLSMTVDHTGSELTVVVRDAGVGLAHFKQEGDLGYGLRIIEQLTQRFAITSAPHAGTEVLMVFALEDEG
jgi:anti-sigma regulatory factor (Ser/Thr protein kinase)